MTGSQDESSSRGMRPLWIVVALGLPVAVAAFTQLEIIQNLRGHLVEGLVWDIGRWEIIADIIAPAWALSLIVLATLLRRLVRIWPGPRGDSPTGWFAQTFLTEGWAIRATWLSTIGSILLVVFAWTREWERFGQRPTAFWYAMLLVTTIALLGVPMWWVRHDLFESTSRYTVESRWFAATNRYLFEEPPHHPRWANVLALSAVTLTLGLVVLGQLDRLLQGMRPEGSPRVGVTSLAALAEADLSTKPALIEERVGIWRAYAESVGDAFASAYQVVVTHILVDTLLVVPAVAAVGMVLIVSAWRRRPKNAAAATRRSYVIITQSALVLLVVVVVADLLENLFTWYVMDRAWHSEALLAGANVRILWAASLVRSVGMGLLVAAAILLVALHGVRFRRFFVGLGAARAELLLLGIVGVVLLTQAQAADVVRQWDVTIALLTVFMATILAMLLHQTSSTTLRRLDDDAASVTAGDLPTPALIEAPGIGAIGLRTAVVAAVFIAATIQIVLRAGLSWPVGLGFIIPAAMIATLWLFGLALPQRPFVRGDRAVSAPARMMIPRFIGAAVFVILGVTVLKASIPQLVFARHEDWYLLFCVVPIAAGLWRLHRGTYDRMGALEVAIVGAVAAAAFVRIIVGDQELSPGALTFAGVMILYGGLPFFYSYARPSLPSRFMTTRMAWVPLRPLISTGTVFGVFVVLVLLARPVRTAPVVGTVAILITGAMFLALIGAGLVRFAERTEAPRLLAAFGINRTPVFIILAIWLLVGGAVVTTGNNVPLLERAEPEPGGLASGAPIEDIWTRWLERNPPSAETHAGGERSAIPMVLVSSSGGGARASVWTAYVMDCLFERTGDGATSCGPYRSAGDGRSGTIAVMSGVSGGGLGLAGYSSYLADSTVPNDDWVRAKMGTDSLSPAMAWLLFVDLPRALVGFGAGVPDRAAVTEWAWEDPWGEGGAMGRGIFDLWDRERDLPPVVFNGTSAGNNCRFNSSVFSTNSQPAGSSCMDLSVFEAGAAVSEGGSLAATDDLADYLCAEQDLRLSTAAHLAARFPIIAPSGRVGAGLTACGSEGRVAYVVDGGYLEGSASGTLVEVWHGIDDLVARHNASNLDEPCIVPFVIHIDNGYEEPTAGASDPDPGELLLPVRTLVGGQFGRYANARQSEAVAFSQPLTAGGAPVIVRSQDGTVIGNRYARLTTRAHPGVQAPLGWSLSAASIDDLRDQLDLPANAAEISEVRTWLDAPLTCEIAG